MVRLSCGYLLCLLTTIISFMCTSAHVITDDQLKDDGDAHGDAHGDGNGNGNGEEYPFYSGGLDAKQLGSSSQVTIQGRFTGELLRVYSASRIWTRN